MGIFHERFKNYVLGSFVMRDIDLRLRQIVKLLESSANVDIRNRQRVVIDGVGTGATGITTELAATLPVSATIAAITSPASVGTSLAAGGQGPAVTPPLALATTVYQPIWEGPVDQRWRVAEDSHISYQMGIRSHLSWS